MLFFVFLSCEQSGERNHASAGGKSNKNYFNQDSLLISDSITYELINTILDNDLSNGILKCNSVLDTDTQIPVYSSTDSLMIAQLDSSFSKIDKRFIFSQLKQANQFILNPKYIINKKVISTDSVRALKDNKAKWAYWHSFRNRNGHQEFCCISKPLFSVNKHLAVVRTTFYDKVGSSGAIFIYKKQRSRWIKYKALETWES